MATVMFDAHGAFVIVNGEVHAQGELIAIDASYIWVLSGTKLMRIPHRQVTTLEVLSYQFSTTGVGPGVLGTASTI